MAEVYISNIHTQGELYIRVCAYVLYSCGTQIVHKPSMPKVLGPATNWPSKTHDYFVRG